MATAPPVLQFMIIERSVLRKILEGKGNSLSSGDREAILDAAGLPTGTMLPVAPPASDPTIANARLEGRVGTTEERLDALEGVVSASVIKWINERLTALEKRIANAPPADGDALHKVEAHVMGRLTSIESNAKDLARKIAGVKASAFKARRKPA